jgi:hypothetical protein
MARKSKPWAVILTTENGAKVRTEHRSKPEAYRKVIEERVQAKAGATRVIAIHVQQWEPGYGQWALYERAYPED